MRFKRYSRGSIVAQPFDDDGAVDLRRPDGRGLLRTSNGIPRSVLERSDILDLAAILACIADGFDSEGCRKCGVEVAS